MKQTYTWLLVAALLALLAPSAVMAEEVAGFSGSVEVGAAGMSVDGEVNKVNEFNSTRDGNGVNPYVKVDFSGGEEAVHADVRAEIMGDDNMNVDLGFDANRVFRLDAEYGEFNHLLSHDQLDYMRATMKTDDQTFGGNPGSANPAVYSEDLVPDQDFFIIHKELDMEGKVVIPSMPNVTLKAGYRQESRKGVEQVFGISHCSACHIEGEAKDIDETTTDVNLGATGKFGMLTVDYEYLTRDFEDDSASLTRDYLLAAKPQDGLPGNGTMMTRLLYDQADGDLPYSETPESEKDRHTLKARLDMSNNSVVSAGYVTADIESSKKNDVGMSLSTSSLETDYDSYSLRASTRLGYWRLSGYGRKEKIDASENTLTFYFSGDPASPVTTTPEKATYQSEEAREITTLGGNAIYRISSGTSIRLGYEYEKEERESDDHADTTTQTLKASIRHRASSKLNTRISYKYQNIDDQFTNPHGNMGPDGSTFSYGSDPQEWYGTDFYTLRLAEASNLPEDIHELKGSATWSPGANYSVTTYVRYRMEENDLNMNTYKQDTFSPGVNVWWAPINNLNMTMTYNFNKQETENQMCVGWYHG